MDLSHIKISFLAAIIYRDADLLRKVASLLDRAYEAQEIKSLWERLKTILLEGEIIWVRKTLELPLLTD